MGRRNMNIIRLKKLRQMRKSKMRIKNKRVLRLQNQASFLQICKIIIIWRSRNKLEIKKIKKLKSEDRVFLFKCIFFLFF